MKIKLLLLFLVGLQLNLQAQITLDKEDLPQVGDSYSTATDTLPNSINVGQAGPDQIWDFSELVEHTTTVTNWISPEGTVAADDFPTANLANDLGVALNYLQITDTALINLGIAGDLFGTGDVTVANIRPTEIVYQIPTLYGTAYTDTYGLDIRVDGSDFGADEIRLKQDARVDVEVDAYGTLTTPGGTFESLRLRRTTTITDSVWVTIFGFEQLFQVDSRTINNLEWLAEGVGGVAATVTLDDDGLPIAANYWYQAGLVQAPIATFTLDTSSSDSAITATCTDNSSNNPTSWLWDFGDGNTSTEQNPTHLYTAAGDYTVCLTVANEGGSNTTCQEYTFELVPIVDFTTSQPTGTNPDTWWFEDASQNNPTTWSWDFGDGTTEEGMAMTQHTYAESGTYSVCLTVSNSVGAASTCKEVVVVLSATEEVEETTFLSISPNPARDKISILNAYQHNSTTTLIIYDAFGREKYQTNMNAIKTLEVNTSNWTNGIYFYILCTDQGQHIDQGQLVVLK